MEYLSVRETAEKWNISARMVQQFCAQGRVPGARKLGKFWAIPALAEKPQNPRLVHQGGAKIPPPGGVLDHANLMPLMNTPFPPGRCLATVEAMAAGPQRDNRPGRIPLFLPVSRRRRQKRPPPISPAPTWPRGCPPA